MLFLQLAILLLCIVVGARLGGIALVTVSGLGLVFFMVVLGMPPGNPPAVVLGMILAVITALSMMEAAGGMDFLVDLAGIGAVIGSSEGAARVNYFHGIRRLRELMQ